MPTYDYRCDACKHTFEKFQSITSGAIRKCPKCAKLKVKRLLGTGAGMIFKGSGFYITDYRSESYKSAAKADSGGSTAPATPAKPAEGAAASKESKPAAKADKADKPASPKK